jgi:uncharacterized phage protein gp47/JayE
MPSLAAPDGSLGSRRVVFSTTEPSRFFTGELIAEALDMKVSVRGSPFTNNPDFIAFIGQKFIVPNPSVFPDGLDLLPGLNKVEVKNVLMNGSESPASSFEVRLVQEADELKGVSPPTNISAERFDRKVVITFETLRDSRIKGYHVYAATSPGGGAIGYTRINVEPVSETFRSEELHNLAQMESDSEITTDLEGIPVADPLYLRLQQVQQSFHDTEQETSQQGSFESVDFNEFLKLDEDVRKVRTEIKVSKVREVEYGKHTHSRVPNPKYPSLALGVFESVPLADPLYYVVTAIYFDEKQQIELESPHSIEVAAAPIKVSQDAWSIPAVTRRDIVQDTVAAIFRSNPDIALQPGSVIRDVVIDPFSSEAERLRFVMDFIYRAQSFSTLLQIDDPSNTGTSLPFSESTYKRALGQALYLGSGDQVQNVLNQAFEKLASNLGVSRRSGRKARGGVVFTTTREPTKTIRIPLGTVVSSGATNYITTTEVEIPLERKASLFNPATGKYSIRASVKAENNGSLGNVGAGQIRTIVGGISGLAVTNDAPMFGGSDRETNRELATRSQRALASVDSGTRFGYHKVAADIPGVVSASIVESGHPLMQRDFDVSTEKHTGGLVDIWTRGALEGKVTDTFAFTFEVIEDMEFEVVGNRKNLVFKSLDPELSTENPIIEMLDSESIGERISLRTKDRFGFRNDSRGYWFDLNNAEVVSCNEIRLDPTLNRYALANLDITDTLRGDYRYRTGTSFVFPRQPVRSVTSVAHLNGDSPEFLDESLFQLWHPNSPIELGRSTKAGDFLQIALPAGESLSAVPSDPLEVLKESHVMVGDYAEFLQNLGANPLTVYVTGLDDIEYIENEDYTLIEGSQTSPYAIRRTQGSRIQDGSEVFISYFHDPNFTVTYKTNMILQVAQENVDSMKHITADVLIKDSIHVPVDISATIVLSRGSDPTSVDTKLRNNLSNYISLLQMGESLRQSDVIEILDSTEGVSYVVVPLTKMAKAENSSVIREIVDVGFGNYKAVWEKDGVVVWLLREPLKYPTYDNGGAANEFRGVFQNDRPLHLVSSVLEVDDAPYQACILGDGGTETLGSSFSREETRNRILVSLPKGAGDIPGRHRYSATYLTSKDSRAVSIDTGPSEYLTLGTLTFTYDEDR